AILRCLEREPARRFAGAAEVIEALDGRGVARRRVGRRWWLVAPALTVAGVVPLGLHLWARHVPPATTVAPVNALRARRAGRGGGLAGVAWRVGARRRERLGVEALAEGEAGRLRSSLPSEAAAVRPYAEGLARLRAYDVLGARELLERAVAIDSGYPLGHA